MPESVELHIKNIQSKLQLLLKKHTTLEKEYSQLKIEIGVHQANEKALSDKNHLLQQQLNILKTSAGQLDGEDKKEFSKTIDQYIKSINKCINLLNT